MLKRSRVRGLLVLVGILIFAGIGYSFIRSSKAAVTGDVNGDNKVDILDLSILASSYGQSGKTLAQGDLTGDGTVNVFDFSVLANHWGETGSGTGVAPTVPANLQICGSAELNSPWSGSGVPAAQKTGGGITTYTSGQYAGLPTFGSAGTDFPNATSGRILAAGDNSTAGNNSSFMANNVLIWLAPGNHTMAGGQFGGWTATPGEVIVGGYASGTGATWDGQNANETGIQGANASHGITVPNVTIEYLSFDNIWHNAINNDNLARNDTSWLIRYNYFHDYGHEEGASSPQGVGVFGNGNINHNCFKNLGQTGINFFGEGGNISYNEFDHDGILVDGNGVDAAMKGWETTNYEITNNYIHNSEYGYGIWLDTSNTGYHIANNYLFWNLRRAIEIEISENGMVENNVLAYNGFGQAGNASSLDNPAIDFNLVGGVNLPGSNYNDSVTVRNNTLWNNWMGVGIFAQGDRTCLEPQPPDNYCPLNDKASFSHASAGDNSLSGDGGGRLQATCVSCSTMSVNYQYALGDKIGFSSGSYPYMVTAATPAGGQTANPATGPPQSQGKWNITVSPAVSGTQASGAPIFGQGTCQLYDNASATPTSPTPASLGHGTQTMSYFDGCQWRVRNVSVLNNSFHFDPTEIQNSTPPYPLTNYGGNTTINLSLCYSGPNYLDLTKAPPNGNSKTCGMNEMIGHPGTPRAPYNSGNFLWAALVSSPSFTSPLNNLDSIANGGRGESPGNNVWTGNTYDGPIGFRIYYNTNSASPTSNPPYSCESAIAGFQPICDVNVSGWASIWQQH